MNAKLRKHFEEAMRQARAAETRGDADATWRALERAHVLGQCFAEPHLRVHVRMLALGWRQRDLGEIAGQIVRVVFAVPASWSGMAPEGNTGGANVGIFQPMPIAEELRAILDDE